MRAFFLVILSLVLFFFDGSSNYFSPLRVKSSFFIMHAQKVVNYPVNLISIIKEQFVNKQVVLERNADLRSELLIINAKLERLNFLEYENSQLQKTIDVVGQMESKMLVAKLLNSVIDDSGGFITLDKGEGDELFIGQPVLDAYGLLGQVILVEPEVSKVLLITNIKSAVPVMVLRNGLHAIVVGTGSSDYLELANVSETADIRVGDSLMTSALGKNFPQGYPVGVVKEIKSVVGGRFMKVVVEPKAHINKGMYAVLVYSWPFDYEGNNERSDDEN